MSDSFTLQKPKTGSAAAGEYDELSGFTMRSDGTREASGINAGMTRKPEAPEGNIASPDNFDATRQDREKEKSTPGSYIHPHIGGRSLP
jgi:hypothetical protein